MKFLFKNFLYLLRRFKSSAIINILGLSAALVVLFIVLMQVHYDFTYDRGYKQAEDIVQFNIYEESETEVGYSTAINFQIPAQIKERVPETEQYCMFNDWGNAIYDIKKENALTEYHSAHTYAVTAGFPDIFTPEIINGNISGIFSSPGKALISEKTAKRIFGEENPIGKELRFHYGGGALIICAVYRDFPDNSSLGNGIYAFLPDNPDANEWSYQAYFLVKKNNLQSANEKINTKEILGEELVKYLEEHPEVKVSYKFSSLNELYLYNTEDGGVKRIFTTVTLLTIGILTLFIAFVNFINLSLAMAPSRVRTINLRKILGINKTFLKLTIAMESVFFTLIALTISLTATYFLKNSTLAQQMFATDLSLWTHAELLAVASITILLISFTIGLYTSQYSTSFEGSQALKGSFALGKQGVKLRNLLIVVQFTTAIVLIIVSTFIRIQHNYMINYDWGIPKENIIYLPLRDLGESSIPFGQELLRDPRITDYCITRNLPGRVGMSWGRQFEGKQINLYIWSVDDRFFDFFGIDIIAGHQPEHMDSIVSQIVVNETFMKKYEFGEEIVGKDFPAFGPGRIQAVAKDINFHSLHEPIVPMGFGVLAQWNNFDYFHIKINGQDIRGTLKHIEDVWKKFSNENFTPQFLDENMEKLYQKENNMSQLIGIFGLIVALIAIMGVYGLIIFNTRYKKKEIGIRKVNGASIKEIILMLNQNLLALLSVSFILATVIGWFIIHIWLATFAYKAPIPWWLFPAAGIIILTISSIAVSGQSLKAARSNPAEIIKSE